VKYRMSMHAEPFGKSSGPVRSLRFGPWLLGISSGANPVCFGELRLKTLLNYRLTPGSGSANSIFLVPVADAQMRCKPAEFPEQPAQVALVPVAEQTSSPPQMWQLVFNGRSNRWPVGVRRTNKPVRSSAEPPGPSGNGPTRRPHFSQWVPRDGEMALAADGRVWRPPYSRSGDRR